MVANSPATACPAADAAAVLLLVMMLMLLLLLMYLLLVRGYSCWFCAATSTFTLTPAASAAVAPVACDDFTSASLLN